MPGRRILLIEDEKPVRQALRRALERSGYLVIEAGDGNLGLSSLEQTPADLVPSLPADAFVLCMTKGHATDRPVLQRALAERDFPFVGVIGSDAKAAVLRRELIASGLTPERASAFHCPVGFDFGSNHPHEIALSIAAQLVSERDRRRKNITAPAPSERALARNS